MHQPQGIHGFVTVKELLVTVSPLAVACRLKLFVPLKRGVMLHPVKVATPLTAPTGAQASVPLPEAIVSVTVAALVVTTLLYMSSIVTTGCGLNGTPEWLLPGVVVNASWEADLGVIVKEVLVPTTFEPPTCTLAVKV